MATTFPTTLDTFTDPSGTQATNATTPTHSGIHSNANDAIAALEAKVGVNSSAVTTTVDYLLKSVSSVNPGHLHSPAGLSAVIDTTSGDIGTMGFNQSAAAGATGKAADAGHVHAFPNLDQTAGDIAALGAQAAGATGKAADAGHVHPTTGVVLTTSTWTGGDLSGTGLAPTVAKVNGVAVTAGAAGVAAGLNGATTRNATGTVVAGETTVFTGSTASQTLTLPASPSSNFVNQVMNTASVSVTLAAGASNTVNKNGTSGSLVLAPGASVELVYISTVWYVLVCSGTCLQTAPPASNTTLGAIVSGTALQNTLGYDVMMLVMVNITVNTSGVIVLGVGPTNTPTQQTIMTGITSTGLVSVPFYLPNLYYAKLTISGTITDTIVSTTAFPV